MPALETNPAAAMQWIARSILAGKGTLADADMFAGAHNAPPNVQRILKTAVTAAGLNDLGEFNYVASGFLESLRSRSVYFRLLQENSFTRVPLHTRFSLMSAGVTGAVVGEGAAIPVRRLALTGQTLEPMRASALIVLTDELVRNVSAASQALFSKELRGAVADAVDATFFSVVVDTSTPQLVSSGDDMDAVRYDLRAMLLAINSAGADQLFWIASQDVAKRMCTMPTGGADAFPNLSPVGGEILNLPCLVSHMLASGTLLLVNAAAIAADAGTVEIARSNAATIQMDDAPSMNSTTPAAAATVSLFQNNLVALKATAIFAVERLKNDAAVSLTSIAYGGEVTV